MSIGGGEAGCWLIVNGEGSGMPNGDIGKAMFAGDFIAEVRRDEGCMYKLCICRIWGRAGGEKAGRLWR